MQGWLAVTYQRFGTVQEELDCLNLEDKIYSLFETSVTDNAA